MIVDRRSVTVNRSAADVRALLKEMFELWEAKLGPVTYRIYTDNIASLDTVAWEWECESLADYERLLKGFFALPELAPMFERWDEVTLPGGSHEIWTLAE